MKNFLRCIVAGSLALASFVAQGQAQSFSTLRATPLKAAADDNAAIVQNLAARVPVDLLQRRGAWSQVKVADKTGWVRMMDLRGNSTVVEAQGGGNSFFAGLNRMLSGDSGRATSRAQSATVGVRGITEQDLRDAEMNPAALARMKTLVASEGDARRMAGQGNLAFRSVAYLANDAVQAAEASGVKK